MVLISARAIWRSPEVFAPVEWCYTPITLKMPLGVLPATGRIALFRSLVGIEIERVLALEAVDCGET